MAGNMNTLMAIEALVDDAAAFNYTVTRGFEVIDFVANTNAAAGGAATITPSKAGVALGSALTVTNVDDIVYGGTVIDAQATFATGEVLRFTGDRADMDATIYALVIPTTWIAG